LWRGRRDKYHSLPAWYEHLRQKGLQPDYTLESESAEGATRDCGESLRSINRVGQYRTCIV